MYNGFNNCFGVLFWAVTWICGFLGQLRKAGLEPNRFATLTF